MSTKNNELIDLVSDPGKAGELYQIWQICVAEASKNKAGLDPYIPLMIRFSELLKAASEVKTG